MPALGTDASVLVCCGGWCLGVMGQVGVYSKGGLILARDGALGSTLSPFCTP